MIKCDNSCVSMYSVIPNGVVDMCSDFLDVAFSGWIFGGLGFITAVIAIAIACYVFINNLVSDVNKELYAVTDILSDINEYAFNSGGIGNIFIIWQCRQAELKEALINLHQTLDKLTVFPIACMYTQLCRFMTNKLPVDLPDVSLVVSEVNEFASYMSKIEYTIKHDLDTLHVWNRQKYKILVKWRDRNITIHDDSDVQFDFSNADSYEQFAKQKIDSLGIGDDSDKYGELFNDITNYAMYINADIDIPRQLDNIKRELVSLLRISGNWIFKHHRVNIRYPYPFDAKRCDYCYEEINENARICKHCGKETDLALFEPIEDN